MPPPTHPRLRATITGQIDPQDENFVWLYDAARWSRTMLRLHRAAVPLLQWFDGGSTLEEIRYELERLNGGTPVAPGALEHITAALDEALFLEGEGLQARQAAFLAARPELLATVTPLDYVGYTRFRCCPPPTLDEKQETLSRFGIGTRLWSQMCHALSDGQKKRVALAYLSLVESPLLLLDEPRANLDSDAEDLLRIVIQRCTDYGGVVMLASHHQADDVFATCQFRVEQGRLERRN